MSRKIKAANSLEGRLVTTENELASFAGEISIQDQIAKAILNDSKNDKDETHLNEWVFKERDWNSFEQFYLNQPYQKIVKKWSNLLSQKTEQWLTQTKTLLRRLLKRLWIIKQPFLLSKTVKESP